MTTLVRLVVASFGLIVFAGLIAVWHDFVWLDPEDSIFGLLLSHPWMAYVGCLALVPVLASAIMQWSAQPPARYLVFANHHPAGGWGDFQQAFTSRTKAARFISSLPKQNWWQVIDVAKREVIATSDGK